MTASTAERVNATAAEATLPISFDHNDNERQFEVGFGTFLVGAGLLDPPVLERASNAARRTGERLDRVLAKLGLMPEADIASALSAFLSLPLATPADIPLAPVLANLIIADFARHNRILPLGANDDSIVVGMVDPLDREPIRALAYLTSRAIVIKIFVPAEFDKAFEALYRGHDDATGRLTSGSADASELDVQRLRDLASEAPVIRLVNQIIAGAVEALASDIHIEPGVDAVLVRFRIDGMLRAVQTVPLSLRAATTSRIKIMSKLDIAERRLPQDGRIKLAVRGVDIDFRVSTIPTVFGESVVMRILDRSRVELDFEKLGFNASHIAALKGLMAEPNGIILVTGPTGSGKTTTLYTALKALNSSERKVFTVEDPIEYQIAGINQVQVQSAIGFDFPHALRSILRQDPDIIMIGEIRDLETARIAIQSSLTGHLVLSTLHTNSAAAAITRLTDMGVENFLLSSTVKGIVAQRLVRRLCLHCAGPHEDAAYWTDKLSSTIHNIDALGSPTILRGCGCERCSGTGFTGRSTIAEVLLIEPALHPLILARAPDAEIERAARDCGMISMYEMGTAMAWRGQTTIEEVLRATRMG
jgi:general secretion pathway protein E